MYFCGISKFAFCFSGLLDHQQFEKHSPMWITKCLDSWITMEKTNFLDKKHKLIYIIIVYTVKFTVHSYIGYFQGTEIQYTKINYCQCPDV